MTRVVGVLLAAGAGSRMRRPKALVVGDDGEPWVRTAARVLIDGGCDDVLVVLGAEAEQARALLDGLRSVVADDWADGIAASLRAGLAAAGDADAALVHLVDLPDVGADVARRIIAVADDTVLARATYAGRPGHPVLIGRDHWAGVIDSASGDSGARDYLSAHDAVEIDCSDLASGRDVDCLPGSPNDSATSSGPMLEG
ncbi:MAG: nucleotidyltransferase family protein [Aeromicrobium sp.]